MEKTLAQFVEENRDRIGVFIARLFERGKPLILRSEIWDEFVSFCGENGYADLLDSLFAETVNATQEAVIDHPWIYLAVRPRVARWVYWRLNAEDFRVERVSVPLFLEVKERLVNSHCDDFALEIDLGPFGRGFPRLKESRSIGRGVEFLNRKLSSELFQDLGKGDKRLLNFLRVHQCGGKQLMLSKRIILRFVPN